MGGSAPKKGQMKCGIHIFSENSETETRADIHTHRATRNGKSIVIIKIKVEKLMRSIRNEISRSIL